MAAAADWTVFFGLWLRKPLRLAAATPSGRILADAVGRHLELHRSGPVLELGAGTGGLTEGLLRQGCPPSRLVVVEREAALVAVLERRFPQVRILAGDATNLGELTAGAGIDGLASVVSSLPIKWFSLEVQRAIVGQSLDLLGPGGRFLQLTNAFASPLPASRLGIASNEIERVWRNFLPAQIWAYSRPDSRPPIPSRRP